jgi:hypothetical protein
MVGIPTAYVKRADPALGAWESGLLVADFRLTMMGRALSHQQSVLSKLQLPGEFFADG